MHFKKASAVRTEQDLQPRRLLELKHLLFESNLPILDNQYKMFPQFLHHPMFNFFTFPPTMAMGRHVLFGFWWRTTKIADETMQVGGNHGNLPVVLRMTELPF